MAFVHGVCHHFCQVTCQVAAGRMSYFLPVPCEQIRNWHVHPVASKVETGTLCITTVPVRLAAMPRLVDTLASHYPRAELASRLRADNSGTCQQRTVALPANCSQLTTRD